MLYLITVRKTKTTYHTYNF